MCPMCITSAAMLLAGTASTGGLTALLVKKARGRLASNSVVRTSNLATPQQQAVEGEPRKAQEHLPVDTKGERP